MNNNDLAVKKLIDAASNILVIQSDRPDGDSIASALFIEAVLEDQGKQVHLYCGVNIPEYLRFIPGWDRISDIIPRDSDITILVDNAANALLDKFNANSDSFGIKTKPFIIADHHTNVKTDIPYATHTISRPDYASAGELLYDIFTEYGYTISVQAKTLVLQSILSDTLGLTTDLATPRTYRLVADFIESGVDRPALEEARKQYGKMDIRVFRYKAQLIERTEFLLNNQVAICVIPETESYDVGTLYNPGPLILSELLMVKDVRVAIAIKTYRQRATVAIRCVHDTAVAHALAEQFGGGGHTHSAGFRVEPFSGDLDNLKEQIISVLQPLLETELFKNS